MGAWLEAYEKLSPEQQDRVQRWLHLNHFICRTLRIPWEKWVDDYLRPAMEKPLDYSFMEACLPGFTGIDAVAGQGVSFSTEVDPATASTSRVPLRAQNNLGRLSPELQDALAGMLAEGAPASAKLLPADVTQLQKIFAREKALAKLDRKHFRSVTLRRDDDDVVFAVEKGPELFRVSVLEMGAVMRKALV